MVMVAAVAVRAGHDRDENMAHDYCDDYAK
jgi:hypothetical protein